MVADALSRKSIGSLAHIAEFRRPFIHELETDGVWFKVTDSDACLAHVQAKQSLVEDVKSA